MPIRRATKLLAAASTLWACFVAAGLVITITSMPTSGSPQATQIAIVYALTPIVQLAFLAAGAVREVSDPRKAAALYMAAAVSVVPELVIIILRV